MLQNYFGGWGGEEIRNYQLQTLQILVIKNIFSFHKPAYRINIFRMDTFSIYKESKYYKNHMFK